MKNSATAKTTSSLIPKLVSFLIGLDGITAFIIGILYFFSIAMTDYFELDATVGAVMRQRAKFVLSTAFIYQIICVISLFYWRRRKPRWVILLGSLAAFHLLGIILLRVTSDDFLINFILTLSIFFSAIINLPLFVFVYKENAKLSASQIKTG